MNTDMKVLIVDDYDTMLKIIRNLLSQMGVTNVEQAKDGAQAFKKLSSEGFDLIISDWNMEPVSGMDLLRLVRASEDGRIKDVPFIMVTAEGKPENVVAAKKAGVDNYIVKPFNAETLRAKIEAVMKKRAA